MVPSPALTNAFADLDDTPRDLNDTPRDLDDTSRDLDGPLPDFANTPLARPKTSPSPTSVSHASTATARRAGAWP